LHDRLWPSTFVSESNLAALINEVRTALCDDALHPRFVRTAHRFGYAFCAEAFECQSVGKAPKGGVTSYWLILETGRFELARGDNVIGRDPHATVWLDLPSISRRHARIVISDEGAHVEDLGSKNGTCIGGRRIELPERVTDRDRITFGSIDATFRIWPASSDIDTETNRDSAHPPSKR
jgi:hypothetical protein